MNLLITCTKNKNSNGKTARDIYSGSQMFKHLEELAKIHGFQLFIRSAKYGFITPETEIETYDFRASGKLKSEYPAGPGYYFGSDDYFSDAPETYQRLLPKMPYGLAGSAINRLKANFQDRELYFAGKSPRSVRQIILDFFQDKGGKIEDLDNFLRSVFLPEKSYIKAIKSVLSDKHKHRGYDKIVEGEWIRLVKQ